MRNIARIVCILLRFLGVWLAINMVLACPFYDLFWITLKPEANRFISVWPNALFLFGWFLVPYSRIRPRLIWTLFFVALSISSYILVTSALDIYKYYSAYTSTSPDRELTLFLIGLSLFTCVSQPLAVWVARYFQLSFRALNQPAVGNAGFAPQSTNEDHRLGVPDR
jgi:hypothetical protein